VAGGASASAGETAAGADHCDGPEDGVSKTPVGGSVRGAVVCAVAPLLIARMREAAVVRHQTFTESSRMRRR